MNRTENIPKSPPSYLKIILAGIVCGIISAFCLGIALDHKLFFGAFMPGVNFSLTLMLLFGVKKSKRNYIPTVIFLALFTMPVTYFIGLHSAQFDFSISLFLCGAAGALWQAIPLTIIFEKGHPARFLSGSLLLGGILSLILLTVPQRHELLTVKEFYLAITLIQLGLLLFTSMVIKENHLSLQKQKS